MLACGTALNILAYVLCETQPPEFGGNELASLKVAGVSSRFVVVTAGEDGAVERVIWRNIDTTLVGKDMVVELPVRETGAECSRDVLQGRL